MTETRIRETTEAQRVRTRFEASLTFGLDDFQIRALDAIDLGASVVVAAPTGSGKTVVAEYAIARAIASGGRVFYTTPIKALSNQKFHDLTEILGPGKVGLLTGDNSVNDGASVVVMTTEVLRNMIYARTSVLDGLSYVILDEVHYLQDSARGPVWEEVIIHTPQEVDLVCLSATVSNAQELADWVTTVRGHTVAVIHDQRPIELTHLYLVGEKADRDIRIVPTFERGRPNPQAARLDASPDSRQRSNLTTPRRVEVIQTLHRNDMLPAITFIFSRSGCDEAVRSCRQAGLQLTSPGERNDISTIVQSHVEGLEETDLAALGFDHFLVCLQHGYAAHHAGMVPAFKEAVEACFVEGLVKAVFATETLALGINMPARTVVIEKLTKFGGERHAFLTPAQFTQLTGRAGRRGRDPVGYAATLWTPFISFEDVAALASHKTYELRSSFRPTHNMAVNLVRRYGPVEAHHLLRLSLAQFQVDRDLVATAKRADDLRSERASYEQQAHCELGDVHEYVRVRERRSARPAASEQVIAAALAGVRPGDVFAPLDANGNLLDVGDVSRNARNGDGWLVVISVAQRRGRGATIRAVAPNGKLLSLTQHDFRSEPVVLAAVKLPQPFNPNSRSFVSSASSALQKVMQRSGVSRSSVRTGSSRPGPVVEVPTLRPAVDHPVSLCADLPRHLKAIRRAGELTSDIDRLDRVATSRSQSLGDQFDRVLQILETLGYLDGWSVTASGDLLAGIFHESDLLIAECIRAGVFDGLNPAQLAGLLSVFVYEERGPGASTRTSAAPRSVGGHDAARRASGDYSSSRNGDLPYGFPKALAPRWWSIERIADHLSQTEADHQLPLTRGVDPGFVGLALQWASGKSFDAVLDSAAVNGGITGGDFVRTIKSLIDLLRQVALVASTDATRTAARSAAEALFRGVVSASTVNDLPMVVTTESDEHDNSQG